MQFLNLLNRRVVVLLAVLTLVVMRPAQTTSMQGTDWNVGDVFVGLGDERGYEAYWADDPSTPELEPPSDNPATPWNEMDAYNLLGTYRVLSEAGTFKEDLTMPVRGITTGCAVDRLTGNFWASSYDEVTVDTLGPLHDSLLGHAVDGSIDVTQHVSNPPGAVAVESILFDRAGNVYVGLPDEEIDFDYDANITRYDSYGTLLKFSPARVKLAEYRPRVDLYPAGYQPAGADTPRGIDWIDLSADGTTLFYTSEDRFIRTFKFDTDPTTPGDQPGPGPGNPLTIGTKTYPATPGVWGYVDPADPADTKTFALRLLPPGDGSGGLLVASPYGIHRVNGSGRRISTIAPPAGADGFFAINISPDAQYVWTATTLYTPSLFKLHIPSGTVMPLGSSDRIELPAPVHGMCVKLEYTAQSVDCTATPDSPLCKPLEACTPLSPGDDDGDGLADAYDPDCALGATEVCTNGIDDDRNGLVDETCDRSNHEQDTVDLSFGSTLPGETRIYSATPLPQGLSIDAATGRITGTLGADSQGDYTVTLTLDRTTASGLHTVVTSTFVWHVANVNLPPVITVQDYVLDERQPFSLVLATVMDPDGDAIVEDVPPFGIWDPSFTYTASTRTLSGYSGEVNATEVHQFFFRARDVDADGNPLHDYIQKSFYITVRDVDEVPNHPPVCTGATLTGGKLWPPNHKLVRFGVGGVTDQDGDTLTITITGIEQNEPTNSTGDGATAVDGVIDGVYAWLRAERAGTRTSRHYRVSFVASDGIATCAGTAYGAVVQHNQGKPPEPPGGTWYDSTIPTPPLAVASKKKTK